MYAYYSNSDIKVTIFYFALEETPERIMHRFMCYLLNDLTGGEIRVSPRDLRSSVNSKPVPEEVLDLLKTDEFQKLLAYFEENIIFSSESNPTGIYKFCRNYAEKHGTLTTKPVTIKDEFGNEKTIEMFDRYEMENPNEYRIVIVDTINLIDTEKGMTLKQSMDKLSEYLAKYLRNRYHYSPVVIQQQAFEQESNNSFKMGKVKPSVAGLGDSKYTSRDSNVVLGLFSPFRFGIDNYEGYNIRIFKDKIRFLEVIVNRDGEMGGVCPLFFDGATCSFSELPKPDNTAELQRVYTYINKINTGKVLFFAMAKNVNTLAKNRCKGYICTILRTIKNLIKHG